MKKQKKIIVWTLLAIWLLIGCSKDNIQPQQTVHLEWSVSANVPSKTYLLSLIDKDDKFEKLTYFNNGHIVVSADLNVGDELELRIWNNHNDITKIQYDVIIIKDYKTDVSSLKQSWDKSCGCVYKYKIK
jgi:hypothetical protein